ncbi:hypothetical protein F5144DRAFT_591278 [Chaetomium tenue]|uniref:Uncharacterized protein n=1 Tax=Chaetomium tenue TaxID=1854479 RepID=A0ACB7PA68_9PEZI|nr:hypothetical protein F5144DRAFT_591278 [Chaetomium globosum]
MCTGKLIRFFCPEAGKHNKLCPSYNATGRIIKDHRRVWVRTEFKCCGRHGGSCVECMDLYEPKNVTVVNAWAVLCDGCGARLRSDIKAIMDHATSSSSTDCNSPRDAKRR